MSLLTITVVPVPCCVPSGDLPANYIVQSHLLNSPPAGSRGRQPASLERDFEQATPLSPPFPGVGEWEEEGGGLFEGALETDWLRPAAASGGRN